ncbi:uncharacterized protein LOC144432368 [Styela clava]
MSYILVRYYNKYDDDDNHPETLALEVVESDTEGCSSVNKIGDLFKWTNNGLSTYKCNKVHVAVALSKLHQDGYRVVASHVVRNPQAHQHATSETWTLVKM